MVNGRGGPGLAYATLLQALSRWVEHGEKPTPAGIAAACSSLQAQIPGCRFEPACRPGPLDERVTPRERPVAGTTADAPRRADAG